MFEYSSEVPCRHPTPQLTGAVVLASSARDDLMEIDGLMDIYDWIADQATPEVALAYVEHMSPHIA